jgi:O-antigen ligase
MRTSWLTKIMLITSVTFLVVLIPRVVPSYLLDRISAVSDAGAKAESRLTLWEAGWRLFTQYPLGGVGVGAYGTASTGEALQAAHNAYVTILAETGIIGFTLFMLYLLTLYYNIRKMPKAERSLWTEILAIWAFVSMTAPTEYAKSTWMLYGMMLAQSSLFNSVRTQVKRIPISTSPSSRFVHRSKGPSPA